MKTHWIFLSCIPACRMSGRDGGQDTADIYHLKPLMERGYQEMKTQLLSFNES